MHKVLKPLQGNILLISKLYEYENKEFEFK